MTTSDDTSPAFPEEWGWERYEPAVREQAAQIARLRLGEEYGVIIQGERAHNSQLIYGWDAHQVRAEALPSVAQREEKSQQFKGIFAALEEQTWEALGRNTIGNVGTAHWEFEKEQNARRDWRPKTRIGKRHDDPDHER